MIPSNPVRLDYKGLSAEERLMDIMGWVNHPAYEQYAQFYKEHYGDENPVETAIRDVSWQVNHVGLDDDNTPPPEGSIHPRYGRVYGRTTFYPFGDWLSHNSHELGKQGINVVVHYGTGYVSDNARHFDQPNPS